MHPDDFLKLIKIRPSKAQVLQLTERLADIQTDLRPIIDLTFHPDKNIAYRASWILETLVINHPAAVFDTLEYLLLKTTEVQYPSCQRHYAKMMMYLTSSKMPENITEKISKADLEPVVEKCFDWMIDPRLLIAVKVFSSETLFNLRHRYPWISAELAEQLKHLMKDGTAAIQSRGRKILLQLAV